MSHSDLLGLTIRRWPWLAAAGLLLASSYFLVQIWLIELSRRESLAHQLNEMTRGNANNAGEVEEEAARAVTTESLERASNALLSRLFLAASQRDVEVGDLDFSIPAQSLAKPNLQKLEVGGKLTGSYPQVKAVLAEVMKEPSSVALDSIVLARQQGQKVEASIRWSVYYRSNPGP